MNTSLRVSQHSCSFPSAESGTRGEHTQALSTSKLMSWPSFEGLWHTCLMCPAPGYGALSVGPGRSADQGLGEASTLLSCCYQQAAPLWRLVLAEPQRALLAHGHLSHGPVTRTSGLSFPPQNTELLLPYSTAPHRTTNGPAYTDQMLALVLAPRQR